MNTQNPFVRQAPVQPKPKPAGISQKDGDMIAKVLAQQVHSIVQPLEKRIEQLETALAYAQEEAARQLQEEADTFISPKGREQ